MKAISVKAAGSRNVAQVLDRISAESAVRLSVAACAVAFVSSLLEGATAQAVAAVAAFAALAGLWFANSTEERGEERAEPRGERAERGEKEEEVSINMKGGKAC